MAIINITDAPYNCVGDGDGGTPTDNQPGFQSAVNALTDGDTLYIPKGVFAGKWKEAGTWVSRSTSGDGYTAAGPKNNIKIRGEGRASVLKRLDIDANALKRNKTLSYETGTNFEIEGITIDNNGALSRAGIFVDLVTGFKMRHCYHIDTADTFSDIDVYFWVVSKSEDVEIIHNWGQFCTTELTDNCRHVLVGWNHTEEPHDVGLWVTVQSNQNRYMEDIDIIDNTYIDPRQHGISVSQDTGGSAPDNSIFRRIRIRDNKVVRLNQASGGIGLRIGAFNGVPATGNLWEDIEVSGNRFHTVQGLTRTKEEITMNHSETGFTFKGMKIVDNEATINAGLSSAPAFHFNRISSGEIGRNRLRGSGNLSSVGMKFGTGITNTEIERNVVENATGTAFQIVGSSGGNRYWRNRVLGSPTTRWDTAGLHATDEFPNLPTRTLADDNQEHLDDHLDLYGFLNQS